jgi:hypothetical protein
MVRIENMGFLSRLSTRPERHRHRDRIDPAAVPWLPVTASVPGHPKPDNAFHPYPKAPDRRPFHGSHEFFREIYESNTPAGYTWSG